MNKWLRKKRRHRQLNNLEENMYASASCCYQRKKQGKKTGKLKKAIRLKNKKMCKQYPWLVPRNRFTDYIAWYDDPYSYTELDDMPKGWRKAFGDIWCEEIDKAIRGTKDYQNFRITQLKEKYGEFRQYFNLYSDELDKVVNAFEVISQHVCVRCGKLDAHIINNYGWYEPVCKDCYQKKGLHGRFQPELRISYEDRLEEAEISADEKIPMAYTIRSYVPKSDSFVDKTYDISDLVAKIRHKNRRRKL